MTNHRDALKQLAQDFAKREVLPIANELDPKKGLIPESLRDQMADLGFFGITIDEKYGGSGLGVYEYCLVSEALSRAWLSVGSLLARGNSLLVGHALSEQQKQALLPEVASGRKLCALAMSEPDVGSDLASISCRADKKTDGSWVITGSKYWCTYADQADFLFVVARTSPPQDANKRYQGLSLFQIEKTRGELPPKTNGSIIPKIGYYGWNTWELHFDGLELPSSALVGIEGKAFTAVASSLEEARLQTAARAVGLAQGATEDAIAYAKERRQFGQAIVDFQNTRFQLAKMQTSVAAARALLYSGAEQLDRGTPAKVEAAMAKYHATEMAETVTSQALQIFGGAGYTTLYPVERYWRDARLTKIFEGSSEIQLKIISDAELAHRH